jgi:hypothetical protein
MKNVHLLPTDKPSRLYTNHGQLHLDSIFQQSNGHTINQNIYITSNSFIKEGNWFLWDDKGVTYLCKRNYTEVGLFDEDNGDVLEGIGISDESQATHTYIVYLKDCKKIILTTDQDLIADDIQAIDDEFLEWFVQNPSCEFVEVKKGKMKVNDDGCRYGFPDMSLYEIIIPQEEPKQETLEEAADNWVRKPVIGTKRESFIAGANWQAERMYTYDEMRTIAYNAYCLGQLDSPTEGKFNEWIQKFKSESYQQKMRDKIDYYKNKFKSE